MNAHVKFLQLYECPHTIIPIFLMFKCFQNKMFWIKDKKEQMKPSVSRRKEMINIKAKINGQSLERQQKRSIKVRVDLLKR